MSSGSRGLGSSPGGFLHLGVLGTDELSGKLVSRGNNNTPCCVVIEIGISSG